MQPFRIENLDHVVIRCADVRRMIDFYVDVVGCAPDRSVERLGLYHLKAGRSMIDLIPVDGELGRQGGAAPGVEGRNVDHVCLRVEPFDEGALRAHFLAHGIDVGPVHQNYGAEGTGPSIYFRDPEGNLIEFKGPPVDHAHGTV